MKKLCYILLSLFCLSFVNAKVFQDGEQLVETFWNTGSYIKVIEDKNNIRYFYKQSVAEICIDEDDIEIASMGYNSSSGKNGAPESYNIRRWKVSNDENGNIIIQKK